jgi:hypothetical protein
MPDPFRTSLEQIAREESERYVRKVPYDPTDYGADRIADTLLAIDRKRKQPFKSVLEIAHATGEAYGAVGVALRQRDGHGLLDPLTEASLARTVVWAYEDAPSKPFGLILAGPTAPARGVRVKPVRPFGLELGSRPPMRHAKLWRVFLSSLYGPLVEGHYPFAYEAPLAGRVRAAELDTADSASLQRREQAIVDPLGYVMDFVAATVRTFERHQPADAARLGLLLSMGRCDQEVAVNGLKQDRRGESLAAHAGWATVVRRSSGLLVPVVEVLHPEHQARLLSDLEYRTPGGVLIRPEEIVSWVLEQAPGEQWEYLPDGEGGVPCALLAGELIDHRSHRSVGRMIVATPNEAPARLLAIPNELDSHGDATIRPELTDEERRAAERVITAWAAENNFTGSCRRRSWFGWNWLSLSVNDIDALELVWRWGAVKRFEHIAFTPDGPIGV